MKPHEETLGVMTYTTTPAFRRVAAHEAVALADGSLVAVTGPAGDAASHDFARLFAASPEMARALLDVLPLLTCCDGVTNVPCSHCRVKNALREAGVLP